MTLRHGTGWKPDPPDHRDRKRFVDFIAKAAIPPSVDLRVSAWSPAYDQGQTNSCTGHAVGFLLEAARVRQSLAPPFVPSSCFAYWNARSLEGSTSDDSGAYLRDGMKGIAGKGVCTEPEWPLEAGVLNEPTSTCYASAQQHRAIDYRSLERHLVDMKACIAAGYPFAFGLTLYESIEAAESSGDIPWPGGGEAVEGHHAIVAIGFDDTTQRFFLRNSWGDWGRAGYGTIPYAYLLEPDMSDDFWTLSIVGG